MKLYSGPVSMFGAKVEIALAEKGLPFELELVPYSFTSGYEPKHPEVLRINPYKHQVPVLVDDDVEIFDSTQIFEYLESLQTGPRCGRLSARPWRAQECRSICRTKSSSPPPFNA